MGIDYKEIIERYKDQLPFDESFYIFVDENGEWLGYNVKSDIDEHEVISVIKEADINKIGEKYPDSVRIGSGETTPYDFGIVGYVEDGNGNARIVYSYDMICESLVKEDGIPYDDAVDWVEYNTIRSLPYIEEKVRPYIIYDDLI